MKHNLQGLIIGLDFDGTVVTHDYPHLGKPIPGAIKVLTKLVASGAKICLNTMRSGKTLDEAVDYLINNGIPLYGINCNPTQKEWTDSPKVYANLYIDDAGLGAPTLFDIDFHSRPFLCWKSVEKMIYTEGMITGERFNPHPV